MKKAALLVGGILAVIAATAALVQNGKTIAAAAVSAYQWVAEVERGRTKVVLDRIERGDPFQVKLYKTFNDLEAGQIYYAWYSRNGKQMTVTGFAGSVKQPHVTNRYSCPNIGTGQINLWGHPFSIQDSKIVDEVQGVSGEICFNDECR